MMAEEIRNVQVRDVRRDLSVKRNNMVRWTGDPNFGDAGAVYIR